MPGTTQKIQLRARAPEGFDLGSQDLKPLLNGSLDETLDSWECELRDHLEAAGESELTGWDIQVLSADGETLLANRRL